jgi:hypothetical protein
LTSRQQVGGAFRGMLGFCEQNPKLRDEALSTWLSLYTSVYGGKVNRLDITLQSQIGDEAQALQQAHELGRSKLTKDQLLQRREIYAEVMNYLRWHEGFRENQMTRLDSQDPIKVISSLENVPVDKINTEHLMMLYDRLLENDMHFRPDRLVRQSLFAFENVVKSVTQMKTDAEALAYAHAVQRQLQKRQTEDLLSFGDVIEVANIVTPIVARYTYAEDLQGLNPARLDDYPRAVDRVLAFMFTDKLVGALEGQGVSGCYGLATECVKLMAFRGVEAKLEQRVLTVGDLVLRYSDLSPAQIRELIEAMQSSNSESETLNRYRSMHKHSRNRMYYEKRRPGYGFMT